MKLTYTADDIKLLRYQRWMTQDDLAAFVGCVVNQIKRWENGRRAIKIQARFLRKLDELADGPAPHAVWTPGLLKKLRMRLRFTQSDLADAIGYEISSIKFWESGHRPPPGSSKDAMGAVKALDKLAAKAGMFE